MSYNSTPNFSPRNVLVIGGSSGIGRGFVQHYLSDERVAAVYLTSRRPDEVEEIHLLRNQYAERCLPYPLDVTKEDDFANLAELLSQQITDLDLIIYAAGVLHEGDLTPEKSLKQVSPAHLVRLYQVNAVGALLTAKYFESFLRHQVPNKFVAISAKVASVGDNQLGGWYGYRASKSALNMFMKNVSIEFGRTCKHTAVAVLHPGTTDTRLSKPFQRNVPEGKLFSVEKTVGLLTKVIADLGVPQSGRFFSWDGSEIPW